MPRNAALFRPIPVAARWVKNLKCEKGNVPYGAKVCPREPHCAPSCGPDPHWGHTGGQRIWGAGWARGAISGVGEVQQAETQLGRAETENRERRRNVGGEVRERRDVLRNRSLCLSGQRRPREWPSGHESNRTKLENGDALTRTDLKMSCPTTKFSNVM